MKTLVLLLLVGTVHAIPKFNQVNKFYHNGTACPATTKYDVQCPLLCVANPEQDCPGPISQQTCPHRLCPDGSCQADCMGVANVCQCATNPTATQLYPCAANKLAVNITHYDPANADEQKYLACATALNRSSTIPIWQDYNPNSADAVWNVCNAPPSLVFPSQAPTFISYLVIYLSFYAFLAVWLVYKNFREKLVYTTSHHRDPYHAEQPSFISEKKEAANDQKTGEASADKFKGYSDDWFGYWMVLYCGIVSVGWMVFLLVISLDYYGYVTGTPYALFYDSYPLSSKAFCVAWFLSTSWYLSINLMRSRLRNFFRVRQPLNKAQYIQVERPHRVQLLDTTYSRSVILDQVLHAEAKIRSFLGLDYIVVTLPVKKTDSHHRYFEYHSTRYIYQSETDTFEQSYIPVILSNQGLSTQEAQERMDLVGPNAIDVQVPTFLKAMWEELTGFFYLYQIMILWCYFYLAYWQIGVADTGVILLAAIIKVIVRLRSEKRIKAMAEHVGACKVLRDGQWQAAASCASLVPGDVIKIEAHQNVPVDAVVLQGDIVVDESSLTGEPLPIRKFPLKESLEQAGKINKLYAGTTIKQATADSIALVLATRTDTDKGKLVQKILFPQPVSFIFHQQLKLVFAILICWAIFLLGIGSWWLGGTGMTAWFYGMTCAAQVMNPLIPAILVVGQSVAGGRLRKLGIHCVDLPRILMAGKVQVFCFDKTGTLTKEGLEYYGIYPVNNSKFSDFKQRYNDLNTSIHTEKVLRIGAASCHSVTTLGDEYIGNPVDIAMFQATGASIEDNTVTLPPSKPDAGAERLEIIQRFEFQHARASMSVAVLDTVTKHVHVFCKGSFERFKSAHNVPENYDHTASKLAREGCYVLAMAHRDLGTDIDVETVRSWSRDELESDLNLLGLVLFKNLLKEDTADAIVQLKEGDMRTVMITGDNALTGISIGQACGLLPADSSVVLGDVQEGQLIWSDPETNEPVDIEKARTANPDLELVMTGVAFRTLLDTNPQLLRSYLFSTRIFARMTPVDKMICVELFMERAITAMCGDGGNDCGALRSAHVGIAMSEAEASVVSPFSTPRRSVQACVDLIIQGRAALATSFSSYKYLIMYGETMATVKFCTFYYTMSFSQWNFILIDAFITVFCSFAVTQAKAATKLSAQRPTARILGPEVLSSVLGQLFINAWFLAGAYIWLYTRDDFFRCNEWDARATDSSKWWLLGDSFEADILTFISLYQFVNAALIFNYGYKFRKAWYHNYLLLFLCALFVSIVSYWELADPNPFGCSVRLNCGNPDVLVSLGYPRPDFYIEPYNNPLGHNVLPRPFRYQLWAYAICNMIATHAWELLVVLGPVRNWIRKRYPVPRPFSKL